MTSPDNKPVVDPSCARGIKDPDAELAVLCGLLRAPGETFDAIVKTAIAPSDFYEWAHGKVFEVLFREASMHPVPSLVRAYKACGRAMLHNVIEVGALRRLLVDAWTCLYWPKDIRSWAFPGPHSMPYCAWMASAMAFKVKCLAARRSTIYKAAEAAQAAIEGVVLPEFD